MEDFDTETIFSNWVQIGNDNDDNSKTWSNSATAPRRLTPETRAVMEEENPIVKKNCTSWCRIFFWGATILQEFPEFIKNSETICNVSRGRIIELSGSCGCSEASERHKLLLTQIKLGFKENPTRSSFENTLNPKTQH
jgi:hypothetical protein